MKFTHLLEHMTDRLDQFQSFFFNLKFLVLSDRNRHSECHICEYRTESDRGLENVNTLSQNWPEGNYFAGYR